MNELAYLPKPGSVSESDKKWLTLTLPGLVHKVYAAQGSLGIFKTSIPLEFL